jgi:diguanylate cyclase (GGDEF)-like protein
MTADRSDVAVDRRNGGRVAARKVLVTDDSVAIRRLLSRSLLAAGYEVLEAADGREAVEICRSEHPDLVLLDVDMPVLDGMGALEAMKAEERLRDIPVLFLTARTGGADVASGLELGAHDYLRKPCDPTELVARVAAALRVKAQEEALHRRAHELDYLSTTDTLTGLGNRRRLEGHIAELDPDTFVSVLILDVDHFKNVNDSEGHAAGDLVLRIVTGRVLTIVEGRHPVVRWGGEEFVVLATGDEANDPGDLGERLRAVIHNTPFAVSPYLSLSVAVSIGCASGRVRDFDGVLKAADDALYEAKRQGRNRVVVAGA